MQNNTTTDYYSYSSYSYYNNNNYKNYNSDKYIDRRTRFYELLKTHHIEQDIYKDFTNDIKQGEIPIKNLMTYVNYMLYGFQFDFIGHYLDFIKNEYETCFNDDKDYEQNIIARAEQLCYLTIDNFENYKKFSLVYVNGFFNYDIEKCKHSNAYIFKYCIKLKNETQKNYFYLDSLFSLKNILGKIFVLADLLIYFEIELNDNFFIKEGDMHP